MLGDVGLVEILVLLALGLFVFGPERLPEVARQAAQALRKVRETAGGLTKQLRDEVPEMADLDLRSLNPRTMITDAVFGDDTQPGTRTAATLAGGGVAAAVHTQRPLQPWEPAPWDPEAT